MPDDHLLQLLFSYDGVSYNKVSRGVTTYFTWST